MNNKDIHVRMKELHDVLVKHKHVSSECTCVSLHAEMRKLWETLNPHPKTYQARAGPSGGGWANIDGRPEVEDMIQDVEPNPVIHDE